MTPEDQDRLAELQEHLIYNDPLYKDGFQAGAASRDAEIAELKNQIADWEWSYNNPNGFKARNHAVIGERDQLRAQVKLLREALEYCVTQVGELATVPGIASAISSTPEQYLAEYRNKVIEECAAVCDKRAARKNDGNWANEEWGWICDANALAADEIRELKETP